MKKSGNAARKDFNSAAARATGGDRAYSGAGSQKLAVSVSVKGGTNRTQLTIKPTPKTAGQWAWANTGTSPGARRYRRGRRKGTVMNHPGTPGRGAWDKTAKTVVPRIVKELQQDLRGSVR